MLASKNIFTAEIVALMNVFETTKAQTSLAMTYYFITCAITQAILSVTIRKINLRIYLTVTGIASAVLTLLMGVAPSITIMYALCAVNGVMQAGVYSGCMAVLARYLFKDMLVYANRIMTIGSSLYAVLSYGVPSLFVGFGLWNFPFFLLGAMFLLSVLFYLWAVNKIKKFPEVVDEKKQENTQKEQVVEDLDEESLVVLKTKKSKGFYVAIMLAFDFISQVIYFTVLNWFPNMLYDVFDFSESYSILITLLVAVIPLVGSIYAINMCEKHRNSYYVASLFALISIVFIAPMVLAFDINVVFSIVMGVLFMTASTGAKNIFCGVIAFKMRNQIDSGSYLAAYNSVASLVAGVIPPLIGQLIDSFSGVKGYGVSYLLVLILSVVFSLTTFVYGAYCERKKSKI